MTIRWRWRSGALAAALVLGAVVPGLLNVVAASGAAAQTDELQQARADAAAAADSFVNAEARLERMEADLEVAQRHLEATRADYDALRAVVAEELVDQYVRAGSSDTPLVGDDLNEQARAAALARAARGRAISKADDLSATKATLDRQVAELSRQREDADAQRARAASEQDALYARLAELEELDRQRQEAERQAEAARKLAEAAAAQAAYEAAAAAASAPAGGSGGGGEARTASPSVAPVPPRPVVPVDWLCPITGAYTYSDTWGAARSNGRSHKGTDIFANYGTPVVATVSGTAVNYGWEDAGGNGVFLLGDDGNRYFYAHLDEFGQLGRVSQGTVVGYVGDTGNAVGTPHLHFEIHPGGSGWTNPYPTLIQYC